MPFKGKTKITDAQRREIAAGRVAGKTLKAIATDTGLSQSTVEKQALDPRTQNLVRALKLEHEPQMRRTFASVLNVIERDVDSIDPAVSHRAISRFIKLLEAGEPALARLTSADSSSGDFTLEELLVVYRRASGS